MTTQDLQTLIVAAYLNDGKDHTVAELAEFGKVSQAKVRKAINDNHGCPSGCMAREEVRASYSKNYTNIQSGAHRVWVYGPTKLTLRDLYLNK